MPVLTTYVCRGWDSNTKPSACEANDQTHRATAVAQVGELLYNYNTVNNKSVL